MPHVATLMSSPRTRALGKDVVAAVEAAARPDRVDWLAPQVACDLWFDQVVDERRLKEVLADALAGLPVDIAIQDPAMRRKKVLLADMDSTMIDQECIDELADEIGIKDHVAAITERSMRGEIEFEPALRERVALLAELETEVIERIIDSRITLAAGGRELVATMNAAGAWTALVSGGFTSFTGPIAARLGFAENRANRLVVAEGRLTGKVVEPILGREAKATALEEICRRLGLATAEAIAVGDGANDLDMLKLAGTGVALHAKPAVAAEARFRIDHGDLTALLYLQGYRAPEFVAS